MTIAELIENLKKYDPERSIHVWDCVNDRPTTEVTLFVGKDGKLVIW